MFYLAPVDNINGDIKPQSIINEAKRSGNIFNIDKFIEAFNNEEINSNTEMLAIELTDVRIELLSPDGFTFDREGKTYDTKEDALEALEVFLRRFDHQGYYSTIHDNRRVQIPLNEVVHYCQFNEVYE